jgi:hypothetical protein
MNHLSPFHERLQRAFEPTSHGVVGLVDNLLGLCREQELELDWQEDKCRVRPLAAGPRVSMEIPLQKSVFRAILARMASLCNERTPDSVSPYGGEGELSVNTSPPTLFRVAFTNTQSEQRLEIRRSESDNVETTDDDGSEGIEQSTRNRSVGTRG